MGGGEKYLCIMAEALAALDGYDVSLLTHPGQVDRLTLERYFSASLDRVQFKEISPFHVRKRLGEAEIAVVMTNYRSMGLPAPRTIYVLQIPYPRITAGSMARSVARGELREGAKDLLRLKLLATCRKATKVLVYSEFVRSALQHHHHLNSSVLYPPIDDFSADIPKERAILSVGRIFHGRYNDKRYEALIDAFCELCGRRENSALQYWIAGSCSNDPTSLAWLADLKRRATGYPVHFHVNAPYSTLATLYARASLFWHAAGYGVDEHLHPERTEHFGMSPIEAMSARCVPLAVNAGGTRETVEHGVSGFLWSTTDELLTYTEKLLDDPDLLARLRQGARNRFARFSRRSFATTLLSKFHDLDAEIG
jgi:glycosyltransferase involved in cell wall biosynthesis